MPVRRRRIYAAVAGFAALAAAALYAGFGRTGTNDTLAEGNPAAQSRAADANAEAKIAFMSGCRRNRGCEGLYVMNADGSGQRRLASAVAAVWSPDGSKLAIGTDFDIWVTDSDGTGQRNLTPDPAGSPRNGWPAWSPDGQKIAFAHARKRGRNWDIYVMNADGSGKRRLIRHRANEIKPAWSPDGKRSPSRGATPSREELGFAARSTS